MSSWKNKLESLLSKHGLLVFVIVCCGFVLLMYGQTLQFDYNLDDHYIQLDDELLSLGLFEQIESTFSLINNEGNYRPITVLSFVIENGLFNPATSRTSHLVNLILYLIIGIQVYLLLRGMKIFTKVSPYLPFVAALFFVVHPIHSEVVGNIKCRDNLLSLSFSLLSLQAILISLNKKTLTKVLFILLSVCGFILALMSKLDAIFVIAAAGIIVLFEHPTKLPRALVYSAVMLLVYNGFNEFIQPDFNSEQATTLSMVGLSENPIILDDYSLLERFAVASQTFWLYLVKLIIPTDYLYYYGYNVFPEFGIISGQTILLTVILFICGIASLFFLRFSAFNFGLLILITGMAYCLNLVVEVAGIIAIRYAFIGSLGFCLIIAAGIFKLKQLKIIVPLSLGLLVFWSLSSQQQVKKWKDLKTLVNTDAPKLMQSHEGLRIAAASYASFADTSKSMNKKAEYLNNALTHIERSNEIYSENNITLVLEGAILTDLGKLEEAVDVYLEAYHLDTTDSRYFELIGDLYYQMKNPDGSLAYYTEGFNRTGEQNLLNKTSTVIYEFSGREKTIEYNNYLKERYPNMPSPYENLSYLFLLEKDTFQAQANIITALKMGSKDQFLAKELDRIVSE